LSKTSASIGRFYRALREDKELQARKFARSGRHKARAKTISPVPPRHPIEITERDPIEVERRDLAIYEAIGGAVALGEWTYA
jgi:hypothetical protein